MNPKSPVYHYHHRRDRHYRLMTTAFIIVSLLVVMISTTPIRSYYVKGFTTRTTRSSSFIGQSHGRKRILEQSFVSSIPITTTTTTSGRQTIVSLGLSPQSTRFQQRWTILGTRYNKIENGWKRSSRIDWVRRFATMSTDEETESRFDDDGDRNDNNDRNNKKKKNQKQKTTSPTNNELTPDQVDKLMAAFDEIALKDGFDTSMSYTADDSTFEDYDFDDDDDGEFLDDDDDEDDDDDKEVINEEVEISDLDAVLDKEIYSLADFEEGNESNSKALKTNSFVDDDDVDDGDDDDYLDFGDDGGDDMDARLAQARKDMVRGSVTIPDELDRFAEYANEQTVRRMGFRPEFNEDTPRDTAKLIVDAMTCPACGSAFQSHDDHKPGFLPREKFDIQVKLSKIEEIQKLKEKAESDEWSPDDEIEWLLQTQGKGDVGRGDDPSDAADIDIDNMAEEMGLDLEKIATKNVICKRCHGLQNFGKVEDSLRPGWTEEPTLSQEKFRELLRPISEKPAVVIALIDLFDFSGSVLRELDGIAGENPVIVAANKADLLPSQMGKQRVENWVRRELEYMGVRSLANIGGAVRLVSCKTGDGVSDMLRKARELAEVMDGDVYVVGAANAGKSTLINNILGRNKDRQDKPVGKIRAGNRNAHKGALTTSPLPGTTLKFIKIDLGDGRSLYDTPGLLVPGTITQLLTPEELKIICPKKYVVLFSLMYQCHLVICESITSCQLTILFSSSRDPSILQKSGAHHFPSCFWKMRSRGRISES
jgi:50S ribosome-binding GTPase